MPDRVVLTREGVKRAEVANQPEGRERNPATADGVGGVMGVEVATLARPLVGTVLAVSTRDPLTFAAWTVALVGLALVAQYLPAHRAANAEPMRA